MKKLRSLREVTESTIYQYNFILSRGISQDGSELEITPETMMMDIKNWWSEQGPKGYEIMQIYALKNIETADPAVAVELDESLVLYSTIQLSDSVALGTVKAVRKGNVIKPEQVLSTLSKIKENKMNKTKMIVKRLREDTEYQKFFQSAMKKFNINSPAELKDPTKKKGFFDYIDKNYKGKSESINEVGSLRMAESPVVAQKVKQVIDLLMSIDVDGETMQYILEEVGMEEQMQHQLTPGGIR